jgi:hypothetical protein
MASLLATDPARFRELLKQYTQLGPYKIGPVRPKDHAVGNLEKLKVSKNDALAF